MSKTAEDLPLPKVRHFTIDGSKEPVEDPAPCMAMDAEDAERVAERQEGAHEAHKAEAKEREKSEDERRQAWADGDLPKPSELLAEREGRSTEKGKKSKSNGEKSKSS